MTKHIRVFDELGFQVGQRYLQAKIVCPDATQMDASRQKSMYLGIFDIMSNRRQVGEQPHCVADGTVVHVAARRHTKEQFNQ